MNGARLLGRLPRAFGRVQHGPSGAAACFIWGAAVCVATLAGTLPAQAVGDQDRQLSLTVYNTDLGVVRDARRMEVESGTHWLRFRDVPSQIDPTSVHLKAVDGGDLEVLEQNYLYDLVSPAKLFDRHLDQEIKVIVEEGRLYEGQLLSHGGGRIVLGGANETEGVVVLSPDKITDIQFPALPEGLITRPTLEWLLGSDRGGERQLEVSYMTGGFNWHAEYVAVVASDENAMDLAGWVSVDNHSGATYPDAELQLVAGDVHRVTPPPPPGARGREAQMYATLNGKKFEEETLFEYHLYTLGRRTTLRENETKQLSLFSPTECAVEKLFEANPRRHGTKVRVVLETTNSEDAGLGMPLPKGKVRVYQSDSRGRLQFVGEDMIDHTPRDEKIRVFVGNAFDLVVERTETDARRIADRVRESDVKIEVRNRKEDEDVVIVVQEDLYGDWRILESSHEYEKKSARRIEFRVPVRARQVETVTYSVRFTY
jgi:hypothetical protein